ncbi:MAG: hypothetical protein AAFU53_01160, partial [Cyanobacteria bacterium J06632_3]
CEYIRIVAGDAIRSPSEIALLLYPAEESNASSLRVRFAGGMGTSVFDGAISINTIHIGNTYQPLIYSNLPDQTAA